MVHFFTGLLAVAAASASLSAEAPKSTVMVMSGITAASEMCLVTAGSGASFAPCLEAIAAGDGRELFQFAAGKLETTDGGKCLQVAGGSIGLSDCAHAGGWELTASGQLKSGDVCLTADGSYPGNEDAAASSPVHASSTSNSKFHGAGAAVDADEASFWQSGEGAQQEFTVDFGANRKLSALEIAWEAPPASFAVELSADGSTWQTAYSTDVNSLFVTKAYLGGASASKARVVMKKPHPLYGYTSGKAAYAIRRLSFLAPRLEAAVADCASAAESKDARDKFFLSYVGEFSSCNSKALRSAVPGLEASKTSLAAATTRLAERVKNMGSCKRSFLATKQPQFPSFLSGVADTSSAVKGSAGLVRRMCGVVGSEDSLGAARSIVAAARAALP